MWKYFSGARPAPIVCLDIVQMLNVAREREEGINDNNWTREAELCQRLNFHITTIPSPLTAAVEHFNYKIEYFRAKLHPLSSCPYRYHVNLWCVSLIKNEISFNDIWIIFSRPPRGLSADHSSTIYNMMNENFFFFFGQTSTSSYSQSSDIIGRSVVIPPFTSFSTQLSALSLSPTTSR